MEARIAPRLGSRRIAEAIPGGPGVTPLRAIGALSFSFEVREQTFSFLSRGAFGLRGELETGLKLDGLRGTRF